MSNSFTYDQNGNAYQLKGGKHTCPSCKRHTLQLYIREADGDPINDEVGKCDRHYNCGYDLKPWAYFEENPDELPEGEGSRRKPGKPETRKPLVTIPAEYVRKSAATATTGNCVFIDILLNMFHAEDVERVCRQYYLGATKGKAVIFWQIDEAGLTHEGKAMAYDYASGRRDKASWATNSSKWIFSTLQGRGHLPSDASSTKILFGQHLLAKADSTTKVCVTESEKNAVFGAIAYPDYTWVAVGSGQELGKLWKVWKTLAKCRSVTIIPDADAVGDWSRKAGTFKMGNMNVWKLCHGHAGGYDLADYIRGKWLANGCRKLTPFTPEGDRQERTPPKPSNASEALQIFRGMDDPEAKLVLAHKLLEMELTAEDRMRVEWYVATYSKARQDPILAPALTGSSLTFCSPKSILERMLADHPSLAGLVKLADVEVLDDVTTF